MRTWAWLLLTSVRLFAAVTDAVRGVAQLQDVPNFDQCRAVLNPANMCLLAVPVEGLLQAGVGLLSLLDDRKPKRNFLSFGHLASCCWLGSGPCKPCISASRAAGDGQ